MRTLIALLAFALAAPTYAEGRSPGAAAPPTNGAPVKKRSNSLSFEDNVVEGMNKNPLDSLQQVGREDGKNHGRLYKKRTEFQNEIRQSVQEAGYSP